MCQFLIQIPLNYYPVPARFSIGWYSIRVIGFLSSGLGFNCPRNQTAINDDGVASAIAGLNWLDRNEPQLDRARDALRRVVTAGHRADAVIENIRTHFKVGLRTRTSLDIDIVIQGALAVLGDKLRTNRVAVQADLNERLPRIRGEQIQLQQVLVNLITNAIDSMVTKNGQRQLFIRSEVHRSNYVMVSVEDTGKGLVPGVVDRIFNPMFTTKTDGMGVGLSICRSIIEAATYWRFRLTWTRQVPDFSFL